jgi:hypothetical protein
VSTKHYFSRPYRGTHYRLYYLGTFFGPSPVFTVIGCQLSRPDGTEIEEPVHTKWSLPAPIDQRAIRANRSMRFNDGLIDPIKSARGKERQAAARYRRVKAVA